MNRHYFIIIYILAGLAGSSLAQDAKVLEIENIVQTVKEGHKNWTPAVKDQALAVRDSIRTGEDSRATLQLNQRHSVRVDQETTIRVTPRMTAGDQPQLDLPQGAILVFSRSPEDQLKVGTPAVNGGSHGTQFFVRVSAGGRSYFQVIEGRVTLSNAHGTIELEAGKADREAGEAVPGSAPRFTAKIDARNILQWALYYPAVLDPAELGMSAAEQRAVARSMAAWRQGDLLGALEQYGNHIPSGTGGRLYKAGVMLVVGRVDEARVLLSGVPRHDAGRRALERMIAAVTETPYPGQPVNALDALLERKSGGGKDVILSRGHEDIPDLSGKVPRQTNLGKEVWRSKVAEENTLTTTGEALAESYYQQAHWNLTAAHCAAVLATRLGPDNGYAWTRLAETEFSFGRHREARAALECALRLTPRHAQAHALDGFVLSAENKISAARAAFEQATELDGALGNGWLGLGLTKIKSGDLEGGRADLQTATMVEPTASIFHSYLGKALSEEGLRIEARKDLDLAKLLDPNDPTPWLYSALENQQNNRTNIAIGELEESIRINDNRRLYRSKFLLDQDRAVRSANLARIYQNAGMFEVAVREATRAVESDYTNSSAHLFLANSFDVLRDPRRIVLRYETPWFNELLLANLLSPVGGGPLSQFVSQQEYSKLLEEDGIGGSLTNEWRDTDELRSTASVFGTSGNVSWGLDGAWLDSPGNRPNNEAKRTEIYGQLKWQATPDDIVYLLGKYQDQRSGDNFETYDNLPLARGFDFREKQEPGLALLGWNHQWAPGVNTLFLGGRLSAIQRLRDPSARQLLIQRNSAGLRPGFVQPDMFGFDEFTDPALRNATPPAVDLGPDASLVYSRALIKAIAPYLGTGNVQSVAASPFDFFTQRNFDLYTAEVQHIWQTKQKRNTLLAGARWQGGTVETDTRLSVERPNFNGGFPTPAAEQHIETDFERTSLYAYDYWQALPGLTLIGGVSWDRMDHPDNFRNPPVNDFQRKDEKLSGKVGFTAAPWRGITLRGAYAQGLGGVTFDESVRLEPVQIAGFNQAYRTVISESLAGSVEAPEFETWGLSAEGRLASRTWWGVAVNVIEQDVDRTVGAFTGYDLGVFPNTPAFFPDSTGQQLDYHEESFSATLNQLLGKEFSVGAGYRVTRSSLHTTFTDIPVPLLPSADVEDKATLHEFSLYANWNSPKGFFARIEANYFLQDLDDDPNAHNPPRDGDNFWQFNAMAGCRFHRNLCEISAGVLNIGGGDYHLSPLSPHPELVREETFVVRCRLSF